METVGSNATTDCPVRIVPPTRYQGSKRRICGWLWSQLAKLDFESVLDAFGGTGCMAYAFKSAGKRVTYNDILRSNEQIAIALVENDRTRLSQSSLRRILAAAEEDLRQTFIADTFRGVYFTDDENRWLDRAQARISLVPDRYERAIAWYALFQSALAKRPYNLFHRRNLYMRTARVKRTFGNKRTWDRPFDEHFARFVRSANDAVIDGPGTCRVTCGDALAAPGDFDLVYIDPPYVTSRGVGVDYAHFYHFLEGILDYDNWASRIDWTSPHRRLLPTPSPWIDARRIAEAFEALVDRCKRSMLAISYRSDGVPAIDELERMLRRAGRKPRVRRHEPRPYALSTNRSSTEVLILAT